MNYTMKEVCEKTGFSGHTLRYYEKEGLLPGVGRTKGGLRTYTDADLETLGLVSCLKNTGMPLADISRFIQLTREGEHTLKERCDMLRKHREDVLEHMAQMQKHLEKVTWKLDLFSKKLAAYEMEQDHETIDGGDCDEHTV